VKAGKKPDAPGDKPVVKETKRAASKIKTARQPAGRHSKSIPESSACLTIKLQQDLLYNISDAAYTMDDRLIITSWNPAAERIYGWRAKEVIGKSAIDVTGEKIGPEIFEILTQVRMEKAPVKFRIEHMDKNGGMLVFDSTIMPQRASGNDLSGYIIINHDITELKRSHDDLLKAWDIAEARAREAEDGENLLNMLLENIPEGIVLSKGDGEHVRISRCLKEWIGSDKTEFTLDAWLNKMPLYTMDGERVKPLELPIARILKNGETIHGGEYLLRPNGLPERIITAEAGPVIDKNGKFNGYVVAWRDITQTKLAEKELRQSEQRLKYHYINSPLAVVEWDANYIVTHWSTEAERIFGWKKEETIGIRIDLLNLIFKDDIQIVEKTMERLSSGSELTVTSTNRNVTKSRDVIVCTWYNSVLLDKNGKMESVMSLIEDITASRRVEEENKRLLLEVQDRAAKLDSIILSMATGLIAYDISGKAIMMNNVAKRLLPEQAFKELTIKQRLETIKWENGDGTPLKPDNIPTVRALRGEMVQNVVMGTVFSENKLWVSASAAPIRSVDGRLFGAVVSFVDITESRRTEELLKINENRLKLLTESILDTFTAIDRNLRFTYWNKTAENISGISAEEALGKTRIEIFGDNEDTRKTTEYQMVCLKTGKSMRYENKTVIDGMTRYFDVRLFPSAEGATIISREVTGRKLAEDARIESEQKFMTIFNSAPVGISLAEIHDGRLIDVNRAWLDITGFTDKKEVVGKTLPELGLPSRIEKWAHVLDEFAENGMARLIEMDIVTRSGVKRAVLVNTDTIEVNGRKVMMSTNEDITERKQAEDILKRDNETFYRLVREKTEALVETKLELEKSKRLSDIGSLAAIVAHELRNPMAAIGVVVYNMKRKTTDQYMTASLENIQKKLSEGVQIINNLLYYSRLKPPHYENTAIYDILDESVGAIADKNGKNAAVEKSYGSLEGVSIPADPIQIKEVFYNILNNALDAAPKDGGRIKISAVKREGAVEIAFENNGEHIRPESLPRIFDPFFTTKAKGTGLGLTVCRQIIDYHNGALNAVSEAGRGTIFTVSLPDSR
jgi:PAS domain S-box-containing protein